MYAREKQFGKAAAILKPIIADKNILETCTDYNLADAVSEIRLQGNLTLARQFASETIAKGDIFNQPMSFQLGLINLEENNFAAAEKNIRNDLDRNDLSRITKANLVPALTQAQMAQGKYDAAYDTVIRATKDLQVQNHGRELLIEVLSHIDKIDAERLFPAYRAIAIENGQITEVGHATQLQDLKNIADTNHDLPPGFAHVVSDWRAGYFPEARRPQTQVDMTMAKAPDFETKTKNMSLDYYTLLQRVPVELALGEVDQAVKDILQSIKSRPKGEYFSEEGLRLDTLMSLGREADVEQIRRALVDISIGAKHQECLAKLATFYIAQQQFAEADACINTGMSDLAAPPGTLKMNDLMWPWLNVAKEFIEAKDYARAIKIVDGIHLAQTQWLGPMNHQKEEVFLLKASIEHLMADDVHAREDARGALLTNKFNSDIAAYAAERERVSQLYGGSINDYGDLQWSEKDSALAAKLNEEKKKNPGLKYLSSIRSFYAPPVKETEVYFEALRSGKLGSPLLAGELEKTASTAVKENNFNQASKDLLRALNIREQVEGKCNDQRSILMEQLACVDALAGKKMHAREWRRKARLAQTINDSNDSKSQTAAYDACVSTLMGDKHGAEAKALEVLQATDPPHYRGPYNQICIEVLAKIGEADEANKWTRAIEEQMGRSSAPHGTQVLPKKVLLIESLLKAD